MSDFIFRLICRWHHNLIISTCCNNGLSLQKEVCDPAHTLSAPTAESSEEDDVYYDASSSNSPSVSA